jgi:hypothetical protein
LEDVVASRNAAPLRIAIFLVGSRDGGGPVLTAGQAPTIVIAGACPDRWRAAGHAGGRVRFALTPAGWKVRAMSYCCVLVDLVSCPESP